MNWSGGSSLNWEVEILGLKAPGLLDLMKMILRFLMHQIRPETTF